MESAVRIPRWAVAFVGMILMLGIPWMSWQTVLLSQLKTDMNHVKPVIVQFSLMQRELGKIEGRLMAIENE